MKKLTIGLASVFFFFVFILVVMVVGTLPTEQEKSKSEFDFADDSKSRDHGPKQIEMWKDLVSDCNAISNTDSLLDFLLVVNMKVDPTENMMVRGEIGESDAKRITNYMADIEFVCLPVKMERYGSDHAWRVYNSG